MVEGVGDDRVLLAEERLEDGAIGIEAGGEEDRIVHAEIGGDAPLERQVKVGGAADEADRGHAEAVTVEAFLGRRHQGRMVGEAQIVVGAEVQNLAAVGDGDVGALVAEDGALDLPQGLVADGLEFGGDIGENGGHDRLPAPPCPRWGLPINMGFGRCGETSVVAARPLPAIARRSGGARPVAVEEEAEAHGQAPVEAPNPGQIDGENGEAERDHPEAEHRQEAEETGENHENAEKEPQDGTAGNVDPAAGEVDFAHARKPAQSLNRHYIGSGRGF